MSSPSASTSTIPQGAQTSIQVAPKEPQPSLFSSQVFSYFIAGGIAGATSRTVVSPLERLKIIQQVQPRTGGTPYKGVWRSLVRMWREEGLKGFLRGNGINCVRIVPYSAVQFSTYEILKKFFTGNGARQLDTPTRLLAGALAGITSVSTTYPLDLVRARLSIASATLSAPLSPSPRVTTSAGHHRSLLTASMSTSAAAMSRAATPEIPGMWGMAVKVMREEGGVRALYRGVVPTAVGVAPYVGINFAAYEWLRGFFTPPGRDHPAWRKLACGAVAGSISQTLTFPFDTIRLRGIFRVEGLAGFYRGIWPNLLKVAPSIATSCVQYLSLRTSRYPLISCLDSTLTNS
ncbi:hypothetical protein BS47DRAFT_1375690 [Hydnum rufescens UP504]|uniref:Mitochondrial carrier n=1 Tax=Hydnum rufescens UP504 TaxID=1448309 RepID=A0A9P6B486_9AGAM|nr:hypothetical protein BS47DRAFT_1375690 [Hydnum rufescens UP504]